MANHTQLQEKLEIKSIPEINVKSKEIAEKLGNFDERYMDSLSKGSTTIRNELDDEFTFHPEILPVSKMIPPKSCDEMCYDPKSAKENNIKKLRKELLEKEAEKFSFQPELDTGMYPDIESKLGLQTNLNTYIERLTKDEESKQNLIKIRQEVKEKEELSECTHTPAINKKVCFTKDKKYSEALQCNTMNSKQKGKYAKDVNV